MGVLRSIAFVALTLLTIRPVLANTTSDKTTQQQSPRHLGYYDNAEGSPIYDLIASAQSTLEMEVYEMDDPKVIAEIRSALARGVVVRIVKEPNPVGSVCKVFDSASSQKESVKSGADSCEDQIKLVDDVRSAGGQYEAFAKPELCGGGKLTKDCLEHGKVAIADAKLALISSGNFNTTNLCDLDYSPTTCNRDYSYLSDDRDIIEALSGVIEKDLLGKAYDVSAEVEAAQNKMTIGPDSLQPLLDFIKSAKTRIQIENQYLKEKNINAALVEAAENGVQVQVIVESACAFGKPKASAKKQVTSIFSQFDKAGVSSKMFNKNILVNGVNGYLHAKAIVIDDKYGWIGSVNGSTQATTINREFGVFFTNTEDVKQLSAKLQSDFDDPNEETWQESLDCAENRK